MNFPYVRLPGVPQDTKRPLIPVKFIHKDKSTLPILCLVDSGADYSYLTIEVAHLLGIDLTHIKPQKAFGINGSEFVCYPSRLEIEVGGVRLQILVHFSPELTPAFPCILGQENFFSQTRILFERYKWNLDIKIVGRNL